MFDSLLILPTLHKRKQLLSLNDTVLWSKSHNAVCKPLGGYWAMACGLTHEWAQATESNLLQTWLLLHHELKQH
jgi:hypothetical protein